MSDNPDPKARDVVPTSNKALAVRSSALIKRGLETLAMFRGRIVRFPADRSMGRLIIYDSDSEGSVYQTLDEARGDIIVAPGKKLSLSVSDEAVFNLSRLASLKPDDLQSLHFWGRPVFDEDLAHIKPLKFLEVLYLVVASEITDAGLEHVGQLTGLKTLFLSQSESDRKITDAGIVYLKNLTNLERLTLRRVSITSAGLACIIELKKLQILELDGTLINGLGLGYLRQLPVLNTLGISNAEIFDADIAQHVRGLTNLRGLSLAGTRITDNGLKYLCSLANLEYLDLARCKISGSALIYLQNLRALKRLGLSDTNVSDAAIDRLQEALPNCRISTPQTSE